MLTVGDLMAVLAELPDDLEVRVGVQPVWPFAHELTGTTFVDHGEDGEYTALYLCDGGQVEYLNDNVCTAFGWQR